MYLYFFRYGEEPSQPTAEEEFESMTSSTQTQRPLTQQSNTTTTLSDEQLERMRRNKEMAAQKKREREEKKRREQEEIIHFNLIALLYVI